MSLTAENKRLLLLTGISVILGFVGGVAAWVLLHLITILTNLALFHTFSTTVRPLEDYDANATLFIAAIAGALVVSVMAKVAPEIRGHGIPEAMDAIITKKSRISPITALAKPISAAIAIGTGAPFGAEGPIIVTGGSFGSLLGQIIPVTPSERKILLSAGAAAGMSATFGTPLAAVILAIELLLFEFSVRAVIPLIVSSAIAGGMHSVFFGHGPIFSVPKHDYAGLSVLPKFILIGISCGILATVLSRGLFFVEDIYRRLPIKEFWHPMIGAIGFASIGFFIPRTLGVGYGSIQDVLNSKLALGTVAVLAIGKLISWWLALGSGTSGGTLAPILLISACFGTIVGAGLNNIVPGPVVALGAFAVVAMASTFGAATKASFTAIVFIFELTRDYDVLLPLMIAGVLADLIFSALNKDSLLTEKLSRRGVLIKRHYRADPFMTTYVESIMSTSVNTIQFDSTIGQTRELLIKGQHSAYPIVQDERAVGIITRDDAIKDMSAPESSLEDYISKDIISVKPSDPVLTVVHLMVDENISHVLVISDDGNLLGIVSRGDLLKVRRHQLDSERIEKRKLLNKKETKLQTE